jgi:hypothetical protein
VGKYGAVGQAADYKTIWRVHFAHWLTKAIVTHFEYVILISFFLFFTAKMVTRARLNVMFVHNIVVLLVLTSNSLCKSWTR